MPSEHNILPDVPLVEQPQQPPQIKLCSSCFRQLSPESISFIHPEAAIVCTPCRERIRAARGVIEHTERQRETSIPGDYGCPIDIPMTYRVPTPVPSPPLTSPTFSHPSTSPTSLISIPHQHQDTLPLASPTESTSQTPSPHASTSLEDPYTDITRLRVRSYNQDCLYPGAHFSGTQKSGRSSYEVSVTIVDVDFSSSFLCGYLRIRGLTDDWPELTTYFDAQIIGSRYGFLTDDWDATEQEDMTHWARFPAFQKVRQEVRGPRLTIRDRDRDCVFMRWKERFLVPDHRVRDINGASFAGFYYVCVEFNPKTGSSASQGCIGDPPPSANETSSTKPDGLRVQRASSVDTPSDPRMLNPESVWQEEFEHESDAATMSGFYFHQNSEPYQQLSLRHVPDSSTGSFEFR